MGYLVREHMSVKSRAGEKPHEDAGPVWQTSAGLMWLSENLSVPAASSPAPIGDTVA